MAVLCLAEILAQTIRFQLAHETDHSFAGLTFAHGALELSIFPSNQQAVSRVMMGLFCHEPF